VFLNRRTTTRSLLWASLAFIMLAGLLVGCVPAAPAPSGEAAPAEEGAAAAPAAGETIDIRFWNHWLAARVELVDKMIADFEAENPDIIVENLGQPWDRRQENMFAALASSDPPEVVMATRAEILKLADDGLIVPIDDYVDKLGLDLGVFYPGEINNMYWDGKLYSMPMPTGGGITGIVLINEDMYEAAGLDPTPPTTWAELEEDAKALTVLDDKGIVKIGANVVGASSGGNAGAFFAWLYNNNGKIYSDDLKTVEFNSPEGVETLQWMVDFTNNINGGVQNVYDFYVTGQEANEAQPWYNDLEAISFPNVSIFFHIQTFKPEMRFKTGLRPFNADNPDAASHGISGEEFGWGYVIPTGVPEEKREAAVKWIEKITYDEDGAGWFMMEQGRPSPIRAVNEDPMYYDVNPEWDVVLQSLENDISVPLFPDHARVRDVVDQAVEAALFGDMTPEEALNNAAEQGQAILDEYWSSKE